MNRLKTWLLRWLGAVSPADLKAEQEVLRVDYSGAIVAAGDFIRNECRAAIADLKAEQEVAITELIQELNALRNSIPVAAQSTHGPVRVFRNFREFRTVVETQNPIRIERKA